MSTLPVTHWGAVFSIGESGTLVPLLKCAASAHSASLQRRRCSTQSLLQNLEVWSSTPHLTWDMQHRAQGVLAGAWGGGGGG